MGRAMDVRDYRALVKQIRARVGAITLSTDLIVGFPGESLKDHEATLSLVEELALARLHVFRFSPRQGTPAALMDGQVPSQMAQVRARELSACGRALAGTWHREHVGRVARVLFESPASRDGQRGWTGLTENYLRVWVPSEPGLGNQIRAVLCTSADDDGLEGTLLAEC